MGDEIKSFIFVFLSYVFKNIRVTRYLDLNTVDRYLAGRRIATTCQRPCLIPRPTYRMMMMMMMMMMMLGAPTVPVLLAS